MTTRRSALVALVTAASMGLAACAGGGASDTVGATAAAEPAAGSTVNLTLGVPPGSLVGVAPAGSTPGGAQ